MGESVAISRFVGNKLGFYPKDNLEAYYADMLVDTAQDVQSVIYKPLFA